MSETVALKVVRYNVNPILQEHSKCCWLACYQMLYQWKGLTAADAETKIVNAKISTKDGLDMSDWGKARTALGLTGFRVSYLKDFANFYSIFSNYGPMWCSGRFLDPSSQTVGHAILVYALDPASKILRYHDPYKLWQTLGQGVELMTHATWCSQIKDADFACQMWDCPPKAAGS